jgi:hypothetical protein
MSEGIEALANAGLISVAKKKQNNTDTNESSITDLTTPDPVLNNAVEEATVKLTPYPTLVQLKSMIDEQESNAPAVIEPPSIEPLEIFLKKRAITIDGLKHLRIRMAKHITHCKISNTVGNSASIIGGILCFIFPPVGVPVLLAGSATSLGKFVYSIH